MNSLITSPSKAILKAILCLKVDGIFLIDGISHIPYLKMNYRDNFHSEINNKEIFDYLLELKNNLNNNIILDFSFQGSGVARLTKKENLKTHEYL